MQPFFTPARSREILDKLKISQLISFSKPSGSPVSFPPVPIFSHAGMKTVITDQPNFRVPYAPRMLYLKTFMLPNDTPEAAAQRKDVLTALYVENSLEDFAAYSQLLIVRLLKERSVGLGKKIRQIDIVKE